MLRCGPLDLLTLSGGFIVVKGLDGFSEKLNFLLLPS